MTLRFDPPAYPGGRHLLKCGRVAVGAVFPPVGTPPGPWAWRCWVTVTGFAQDGHARSETAAKNACMARFREFEQAAGLTHSAPERTLT